MATAFFGGANPVEIVIYSVDTAGGFPVVNQFPPFSTQNGWIEIKGANLTPATVGPQGLTWNGAPQFASGTLPARLAGVSVTVNGEPALVYYVSATQINVLTAFDSTMGMGRSS